MSRAEPARHVFWGAMHDNVLGRADHMQDLGRAMPAQEKNRWPNTAHKPMDYSCRVMSCRAVLVGRANGLCLWAVLMGYNSELLFFQKILISK